jgi:hypothetical protein
MDPVMVHADPVTMCISNERQLCVDGFGKPHGWARFLFFFNLLIETGLPL